PAVKKDYKNRHKKRIRKRKGTEDFDDETARARLMSNGTKVWKLRRKKMLAKIGTWNIRTMLVGGKMEEVAREMLAYKIKILALQELRWAGKGRIDKEKYT